MKIANPDRELVASRFAGSKIHTMLWERHLRKMAAAGRIGVHTTTLNKKLRGNVPLSVDELMELADLLAVEPHVLLPTLDEWYAMRDLNPQPADLESRRRSDFELAA